MLDILPGWAWLLLFIWFFPERVLSVIILGAYLMVWLPWGLLPWYFHLPLVVAYMCFTPREWPAFRAWSGWDWKRRSYFGMSVDDPHGTLTSAKPPPNPRMYLFHPHGMYGGCVIFSLILNRDHLDVVPVGTTILTWLPIVKDFCGLGGMVPADRPAIMEKLHAGRSVAMIPDGVRGILSQDEPGQIPYKRRRGFAKCAVDAGADIVVVWAEGQNDLYRMWLPPWFRGVQHWMLGTRMRYCPLFCWGWGYGFWPRPLPFTLHVSRVISPPDEGDHCEMVTAMQDAYYYTLGDLKRGVNE